MEYLDNWEDEEETRVEDPAMQLNKSKTKLDDSAVGFTKDRTRNSTGDEKEYQEQA